MQCTLETVNLDTAPPYVALSYTWSSPFPVADGGESPTKSWSDSDTVWILLNGRSHAVTKNLADAMYHLSKLELTYPFWIDAICINQADIVERNLQVSMMGDIYVFAQKVLVWLGKEDLNSSGVNVFISDALPEITKMIRDNSTDSDMSLGFPFMSTYENCGGNLEAFDNVRPRLSSFFERTWFSRVWKFQESLLAREVVLYCGEKQPSWDLRREVLHFLALGDWTSGLSRNQKPDWQVSEEVLSTMTRHRLRWLDQDNFMAAEHRMRKATAGGKDSAVDCLMEYLDQIMSLMRLRTATDPRDHIFGIFGIVQRLCNIADLRNPLPQPDYSNSASEIFTECCRALIEQTNSLRLFSNVEDSSQYSDRPSFMGTQSYNNRTPKSSVTGKWQDI